MSEVEIDTNYANSHTNQMLGLEYSRNIEKNQPNVSDVAAFQSLLGEQVERDRKQNLKKEMSQDQPQQEMRGSSPTFDSLFRSDGTFFAANPFRKTSTKVNAVVSDDPEIQSQHLDRDVAPDNDYRESWSPLSSTTLRGRLREVDEFEGPSVMLSEMIQNGATGTSTASIAKGIHAQGATEIHMRSADDAAALSETIQNATTKTSALGTSITKDGHFQGTDLDLESGSENSEQLKVPQQIAPHNATELSRTGKINRDAAVNEFYQEKQDDGSDEASHKINEITAESVLEQFAGDKILNALLQTSDASITTAAAQVAKIGDEIIKYMIVQAVRDVKQEVIITFKENILPGTQVSLVREGTALSLNFTTADAQSLNFLNANYDGLFHYLQEQLKDVTYIAIHIKQEEDGLMKHNQPKQQQSQNEEESNHENQDEHAVAS
ncbi:MAG: type III secretion HpaP family protein [Puniceicoccales bacterium]|jgi:hypothetical protein|nr:type III secretion HpaP family protein [Puniceicoccales bacterium]